MSAEENDLAGRRAHQVRTAFHEAAHVVAGAAVGHRPRMATIVPGRTFNGCAVTRRGDVPDRDLDAFAELPQAVPTLAPARLRRYVEASAIELLAGEEAWGISTVWAMENDISGYPDHFRADPDVHLRDQREQRMLTLRDLELVNANRAAIDSVSDQEVLDDEGHAYRMLSVLNGNDLIATAAHVEHLRATARRILTGRPDTVTRIGVALLERGTLGGAALAELLTPPPPRFALGRPV